MPTLTTRLWLGYVLFMLFLLMDLAPSAGAHPAGPDVSTVPPPPATNAVPRPTSALGVECSQIPVLHLAQQTNLRAARIVAACAGQPLPAPPAGGPRTVGGTPHTSPDAYGGTDRDIIT